MKKIICAITIICAVFTFSACDGGHDNDGKTNVINDSISNIFPSCQAFHANIYDNREGINIVLGDLTFYKASEEERKRKADELAKMILRIYGKDNYLKRGTLIVTKDIRNTSEAPTDGITTPIPITELKKAGY